MFLFFLFFKQKTAYEMRISDWISDVCSSDLFLTMLGIIIGIASVVCVVALGEGSRQTVLASISRLGTNTLEIFPGKDFGDIRSGKITSLVAADAEALDRKRTRLNSSH